MEMLRRSCKRLAVVTTRPPSATATPMSVTVPWPVVAWSSTIDLAAVCADAGTPLSGPVSVVSVASLLAVPPEPASGVCEEGESRTTRNAPTATTAAGPDQDHERAAVAALGRRGQHRPAPGTRRDLARVAPQAVVGVYPAAQPRFGLVGVRPSLVTARIAGFRLLGRPIHLGEATENNEESAVAPRGGRTMSPHVT